VFRTLNRTIVGACALGACLGVAACGGSSQSASSTTTTTATSPVTSTSVSTSSTTVSTSSAANLPSPAALATYRAALAAYAGCMTAHGVKIAPPRNNARGIPSIGNGGANTKSRRFLLAFKACFPFVRRIHPIEGG
jgi:hypothetical protein